MAQHQKRSSPATGRGLKAIGGRGSDDSSDSGVSFVTQDTNHQNSEPQRGNRGGHRGNRGNRGGSRANSSSSGSSAGRRKPKRPILTSSPSRSTTPVSSPRAAGAPTRLPLTPTAQQPSVSNGSHIKKTPVARPGTSADLPSPSHGNNRHHNKSPGSRLPFRPVTMNQEQNWAYHQEEKIRLQDIPRAYWTNDIYQTLSRYGTIVRIEMQPRSDCHNAFVVFRPPPPNRFPQQSIRIGEAFVQWVPMSPYVNPVISPVNPAQSYPEFNIQTANSIDFGYEDAPRSMIAMRTITSPGRVQATLNLKKKEIDIQFPLKPDQQERKYRLLLPISLLSQIYKLFDKKTGQVTLIIPFKSAPRFFTQKREGEKLANGQPYTSFSPNEKLWSDWDTWFRETDVIDDFSRQQLKDKPVMNHKDTAIIDIGRWTTYRLSFDEATLKTQKYVDFHRALADFGVVIEEIDNYIVKDRIPPHIWLALQEEIAGTHPHLEPASNESTLHDLFTSQIHLAFPIRYQLEVCLSNGYLKEHTITSEFLAKLSSLGPRQAEYILEKVAERQTTYYNPMDIFGIRVRGNAERSLPSYCTLQRSVVITPTMMHVATPAMETSNRILRNYSADADRFIRVKFSDEKSEGLLWNMVNGRADALFDKVLRALMNGIVVAGRYYEFLAFGNSQFREHGAFFYAPTSSKSADDIRLSLGRFDHIKTVPKFGARLGQCFSTTRAMRVNVKIVKIPDIERNGYNFTDGVGKISLFLAQMAAQELGLLNAFDDPPSLYQFRLGGCKGVLALDPKVTGDDVHIRPSQHKFEAKFNGLEIIRSSALATPFFNRQIIMVLSNLGVEDKVFIRKQQEMVNDYEQAMTDEFVALEKLQKHIDMNQTTLTMASMVLDGFMKTKEPFLMSLLALWRSCTIKNLKEKARIAIEDGAFVLGCVDETSTLRGHMEEPQSRHDATKEEKLATLPEIFLRVDDFGKKGRYKVIEGICILARNPSLHPGDIRVVRAIDVPALHHLKNVVVLPNTGDRDLANMCSGGDLDGDDYMVLWDREIYPKTINEPPMDFTPQKMPQTDKPITVVDMSNFFVQYMKNNSLGQIAHAHLAQADLQANGVFSDICLQLAELHSQAVDYPKSGVPAFMHRELRPAKWPHFMEKKYLAENRTYHSTGILGQLYDQVQLIDFKPKLENTFDDRVLKAFELGDQILCQAADIKASYDQSLKRLMAKHGIRTEFEAWSVFVLEHNHESNDYKFAEEFGRTIDALKAHFKQLCREAAGVDKTPDWSKLGPFVAAMYTVTAREVVEAISESQANPTVEGQEEEPTEMDNMPLISFPWLFPSELGKIATGTSVTRQQAVEATQDVSRRPKKQTDRSHKTVLINSTVETEQGTTHYGELLNLDFGSLQSETKST